MGEASAPRVIAVVVTYNRRELLLEALAAVCSQSRAPDEVIVVDNASTDGSAAAVRSRFPSAQLAKLSANTGGAGGFACGAALALAGAADLIWFMDDDTVPGPDALAALLEARGRHPGPPPAVIASRVLWTDGRVHPMNTPRVKPFATRSERAAAARSGCQPIRSASFVSILVDAGVCRERGLPQADYFLWNDDFEFTARVLRSRHGLFVPQSVVVHKTKARADTDADPGERFYFEVRNKLWLFRASPALAWWERPLYLGATVRRWVRTYVRSNDRPTIARTFRSGWRDGTRRLPSGNPDYLRSLGVEDADTVTFDGPRI